MCVCVCNFTVMVYLSCKAKPEKQPDILDGNLNSMLISWVIVGKHLTSYNLIFLTENMGIITLSLPFLLDC